jgi:DNA-binding MurR/RpiR family transcriptional regulator
MIEILNFRGFEAVKLYAENELAATRKMHTAELSKAYPDNALLQALEPKMNDLHQTVEQLNRLIDGRLKAVDFNAVTQN